MNSEDIQFIFGSNQNYTPNILSERETVLFRQIKCLTDESENDNRHVDQFLRLRPLRSPTNSTRQKEKRQKKQNNKPVPQKKGIISQASEKKEKKIQSRCQKIQKGKKISKKTKMNENKKQIGQSSNLYEEE